MYPKDYYHNFDEIVDSVKDDDGLLHVELFSITDETKCPVVEAPISKKSVFAKRKDSWI